MAITLPSTSPRTTNTGSRPRVAAVKTGGDVQQPAIRRDPGVQIADPGPSALEDVAGGAQDFADGLIKERDHAQDVNDTVSRAQARKAMTLSTNDRMSNFELAGDPTDKAQRDELAGEIEAERAELLAKLTAGGMRPKSLAIIDGIFSGIETQASVRLGDLRISAGKAALEDIYGESVAPLVKQAFDNPQNTFGLASSSRDEMALVAKGLSIDRETFLQDGADAAIFEAGFKGTLAKGGREKALEFLGTPGVAEALGSKKTLTLRESIKNAPRAPRIVSKEQAQSMGLPAGYTFQIKTVNGNDEISTLIKPPADEGLRGKRIEAATRQLQKENPEMAPEDIAIRAAGIVDKTYQLLINPWDGTAALKDVVAGTITEIPRGQAMGITAANEPTPQGRTLWEIARGGNIAGIVPAVQSAAEVLGQIPGFPVATNVIRDRQEITTASQELVRALVLSERFSPTEMERIREEVNITPDMWASTPGLLARMVGIKRQLTSRVANELRAAADTSLPSRTRGKAKRAANDIQNFLNRLGAPDDFDPDIELPPGNIPGDAVKIGINKDGNDMWENVDKDGKRHRWVAE